MQVHGADSVLKREYGDLLVPADDGRNWRDCLDDLMITLDNSLIMTMTTVSMIPDSAFSQGSTWLFSWT